MEYKTNLFGDVRAEADSKMLDAAFYESADYLSLTESSDRTIIVGRRGTGKSALCYKLEKKWRQEKGTKVIRLTPDEAQMIGLREIANLFGEKFSHIKAGTRIAWRYAIYMEVITALSSHYKFDKTSIPETLAERLKVWWGKTKRRCRKTQKNIERSYS